ncbi:MAG TPA: hypothetical protein VFK35_13645 [Candidatus Limnocylindrales bacterium]|nr:hypothetical protein [Candidatus Limnocylindrales bacterium]
MNRYERRQYFERLCTMRSAYGQRGSADATSVITIDAMIRRAIWLLERPRAALVVVNDDGSQVA